jgi:hypothetical protein
VKASALVLKQEGLDAEVGATVAEDAR